MNYNYLYGVSEELKKRVQERIQLLNSKIEMDIINAKKECLSYDARLEHDMKSWVRDEIREMILKDSIKNNRQVDDKVKIVKKELMEKIEQ